ncbi:hypothetical protein JCM33774_17790 [Actinophytocola sp. KF-1]
MWTHPQDSVKAESLLAGAAPAFRARSAPNPAKRAKPQHPLRGACHPVDLAKPDHTVSRGPEARRAHMPKAAGPP